MGHEGFTLTDAEDARKEIHFTELGWHLWIEVWDGCDVEEISLDLEACEFILANLPKLVDKIRAYTEKRKGE
jgi:hypothetical protein